MCLNPYSPQYSTALKVMNFLRSLSVEMRNEWAALVTCRNIAKQIRVNRKSRGWSKAELASRSGLSYMTIWRIENRTGIGIAKSSSSTLIAIAKAFECALILRFCSWGEWVEWIITPVRSTIRFCDEPLFASNLEGKK